MGSCRIVDDFLTVKVSYTGYKAVVTGMLNDQIALSQVDEDVSSKMLFSTPEGVFGEPDYFCVGHGLIASGSFGYPIPDAPTFSLESGMSYIDMVFPLTTTISHNSTGDWVGRQIYYTTDGSTPTTASALYDEVHAHIPGFDPGDLPGTLRQVKAVVYKHVYGPVAILEVVKMGSFLWPT